MSLAMGVVIHVAVARGLMLRLGVPTSQPRRQHEERAGAGGYFEVQTARGARYGYL